jgi:hypothetical protein
MFGGTLQIIYPAMNQIGVPPGALEVSGNWTDRGMPEPYVLERITIWLDEDPGIEAQITRIVNPGASVYSGTFKSPAGSLTVADGTHRELCKTAQPQATDLLRRLRRAEFRISLIGSWWLRSTTTAQ